MPAHKILLVDDDREICQLLEKYLKEQGYDIATANDFAHMKRVLKTKTFDLILLDIMLPGSNGIEICKWLRQSSSVMILMLSAMGSEADRILGLEIGADDYLPKPFNPRELLARIRALFRRAEGNIATERELHF